MSSLFAFRMDCLYLQKSAAFEIVFYRKPYIAKRNAPVHGVSTIVMSKPSRPSDQYKTVPCLNGARYAVALHRSLVGMWIRISIDTI